MSLEDEEEWASRSRVGHQILDFTHCLICVVLVAIVYVLHTVNVILVFYVVRGWFFFPSSAIFPSRKGFLCTVRFFPKSVLTHTLN